MEKLWAYFTIVSHCLGSVLTITHLGIHVIGVEVVIIGEFSPRFNVVAGKQSNTVNPIHIPWEKIDTST